MKHFLGAAAGAGLSALVMSPSAATTVELEFIGGSDDAFRVGSVVATRDSSDPKTVEAGVIPMRESDGDGNAIREFIAWCIDVTTSLASTASYIQQSGRPSFLSPDQETLINSLFTGFIGETDTDDGAAAFQLAMWEIIEDGPGGFDLDGGSFSVVSGDPSDDSVPSQLFSDEVVGKATDWLGELGGIDPRYRLTYFIATEDDQGQLTSQSLVTATPIPLPAGIWLLGAGVGALALARRRGSRRADA